MILEEVEKGLFSSTSSDWLKEGNLTQHVGLGDSDTSRS